MDPAHWHCPGSRADSGRAELCAGAGAGRCFPRILGNCSSRQQRQPQVRAAPASLLRAGGDWVHLHCARGVDGDVAGGSR